MNVLYPSIVLMPVYGYELRYCQMSDVTKILDQLTFNNNNAVVPLQLTIIILLCIDQPRCSASLHLPPRVAA